MLFKHPCLIPVVALMAFNANADELSLQRTEVVPGITMLMGVGGFYGGNIALITGSDGTALIDNGIEPYSQMTLEAVQAITGRPLDFVINTHAHGDHLGGNKALHAAGANIVAHDNIRLRLLDKGWASGNTYRPAEFGELPQVTFSDTATLHLNGHSAHIVHIPAAHTDGDSIVVFADVNVVHTGDLLFNGMFPFIDLDSGGSVDGYIAGQELLLKLIDDETKVIAGHGPLATKADVQAALDMLVDANSRIGKLVAQGKSADDIVALNPLADYHDGWNWAFITTERMTRQLARSHSPSTTP